MRHHEAGGLAGADLRSRPTFDDLCDCAAGGGAREGYDEEAEKKWIGIYIGNERRWEVRKIGAACVVELNDGGNGVEWGRVQRHWRQRVGSEAHGNDDSGCRAARTCSL